MFCLLVLPLILLSVVTWILHWSVTSNFFSSENKHIVTKYYSVARVDGSGCAIHDMLLAQAYSFREGGVYGGACLRLLPFYPWHATVKLLQETGLDTVLKFACPSRFDRTAIILPARTYRTLDSELFTKEWRSNFLKHYDVVEKGDNIMFHIVVHVRRGDVEPCNHPKRYLPNTHYLNLIQQFLPPSQKAVVTIYSQSKSYESFDVFRAQNYTVNLDSPLSQVWKDIMSADIVILSQSTFSYVPSVFNTKTVVYTPFEFKPVAGWTVVDKDMLQAAVTESLSLKTEACKVIPKRGWWKKYGRTKLQKLLLFPLTDHPRK
jgi:hypothetical protein